MNINGWSIRLLDPPLFWRKLALLLLFSVAFVPLKAYNLDKALNYYIAFLLFLHVYFVFVLVYRVRWHVLSADRRSFILRLLAVALFIALLVANNTGATLWEFVVFLAISLVIHTGLLLSLTVVARRDPNPKTTPQ